MAVNATTPYFLTIFQAIFQPRPLSAFSPGLGKVHIALF
jgi:hypothetical protein